MSSREIVFSAAGASGPVNYIESCFSTYLYTGNGSTQTITNGIDLAGKGGMVWIKSRSAATNNVLFDTARGVQKYLVSNNTDPSYIDTPSLTAFNTSGFNLGAGNSAGVQVNTSNATYCSWTFRKKPKFFDIVTYTGNGGSNRQIAHSLDSVPGMIIVKNTSDGGSWFVWHRSLTTGTNGNTLFLNSTAAYAGGGNPVWSEIGNLPPTNSSTTFQVGSGPANTSGGTYVAYLFAHNAGGFGTTGTDNVISCGSFTCDGSGLATVDLGYEPQYVLIKASSTTGNWIALDTMRGFTVEGSVDARLYPNLSSAESNTSDVCAINSTGFKFLDGSSSATFIYMAIRRPMAVPTSGTQVFSPVFGTATNPSFVTNFPVDMVIQKETTGNPTYNASRLAGQRYLTMSSTAAEGADATEKWDYQNGQGTSTYNGYIGWNLARRPGFFDVVCYTGNVSTNTQITHNLGVAPELIIVKSRTVGGGSGEWAVYNSSLGKDYFLTLNSTDAPINVSDYWSTTAPTATTFGIGASGYWNNNGNEVAYLFATCPGVSKVGSYTGTGATQTINCGFTGGARFVLIKRTDSTGNWYVWDTARGMVSGTDPSLLLNSTAAEVNANSVYTATTGFQIVSTTAGINASGGSYIFLAIA